MNINDVVYVADADGRLARMTTDTSNEGFTTRIEPVSGEGVGGGVGGGGVGGSDISGDAAGGTAGDAAGGTAGDGASTSGGTDPATVRRRAAKLARRTGDMNAGVASMSDNTQLSYQHAQSAAAARAPLGR
jgi:hypothetical protein